MKEGDENKMSQFRKDLAVAKEAENIVAEVFSASGCYVRDISDIAAYYHTGDLEVIDASGDRHFIEVKDDSRIADTHNVLLEDGVYYSNTDEYIKGNIHGNYEWYAVVSKKSRQIYLFDFPLLKKIGLKYGIYKRINHPT